jgi:hypothetical protein
MTRRLAAAGALLCVLGAMTGCASNRATATLLPGAELGRVRTAYIVHADTDNHGVDETLRKAFRNHGIDATVGPAHAPPYPSDVTVTYVDKWFWDITMYMIELTVTVRDPTNDFPLATGNSMHTSLARKSPEEMTDEVVANILAAKH